jgi:hypothetical protein
VPTEDPEVSATTNHRDGKISATMKLLFDELPVVDEQCPETFACLP